MGIFCICFAYKVGAEHKTSCCEWLRIRTSGKNEDKGISVS